MMELIHDHADDKHPLLNELECPICQWVVQVEESTIREPEAGIAAELHAQEGTPDDRQRHAAHHIG